jgi:hypothetical protein
MVMGISQVVMGAWPRVMGNRGPADRAMGMVMGVQGDCSGCRTAVLTAPVRGPIAFVAVPVVPGQGTDLGRGAGRRVDWLAIRYARRRKAGNSAWAKVAVVAGSRGIIARAGSTEQLVGTALFDRNAASQRRRRPEDRRSQADEGQCSTDDRRSRPMRAILLEDGQSSFGDGQSSPDDGGCPTPRGPREPDLRLEQASPGHGLDRIRVIPSGGPVPGH